MGTVTGSGGGRADHADQAYHRSVDRVLAMIMATPRSPRRRGDRHRLGSLFADLARPYPSRPVGEIEDLIWAIWSSHEDGRAEEAMETATVHLAEGRLADARPLLDDLVTRYPDWAEAWNKRATLSFIETRDHAAIDDIGETLTREPRHFGAIAGFGQICLRNGGLREARASFGVALRLNPHLHGVRAMLHRLGDLTPTVH